MRYPEIQGIASAWKMAVGPDARPEQEANILSYVVNGPYHPHWSWWAVSVIHLRGIPGAQPPHRQYPEAEYELMILSIDPETPPNPDKPFPQDIRYLEPPDVVCQFHGITDDQAAKVCDSVVRAICAGRSCDSDYRSFWEDAIESTVDHFRPGGHMQGGDNGR